MPGPRTKPQAVVSTAVSPQLKERLESIAERDLTTMSTIVRQLINAYVKENF